MAEALADRGFRHALEATRSIPGPARALREPDARVGPAPARRPRLARAETTPEATGEMPALVPFRPLPAVLVAPPAPVLQPPGPTVSPSPLLRLRVGRSREGEIVQLRLRAPDGSELDVEVIASSRGVVIHAGDASPAWRARLARALDARGVQAEVV
ncbi:MAG: hypothetical protein OHK0013_08370 [Sandaracinaceae bacterium]